MKLGNIRIKLHPNITRKSKSDLKSLIRKQKGVDTVWYVDNDTSGEWDLFVELKVTDRNEAEELDKLINSYIDILRTELRVEIGI